MKVSVKVKSKKFKALKAKLDKLKGAKAEYGYFEEQGLHSEWGESYVDLAKWQEFGTVNASGVQHIPPRPVFAITKNQLARKNILKGEVKAAFREFLKSPSATGEEVLAAIAKTFGRATQKNFGSSLLKDNHPTTIRQKGTNNPLIWTGELASKMAYRTSMNTTIREV